MAEHHRAPSEIAKRILEDFAFGQVRLCPVCGEKTGLQGRTKDGRVFARCGDAFSAKSWLEDELCDFDESFGVGRVFFVHEVVIMRAHNALVFPGMIAVVARAEDGEILGAAADEDEAAAIARVRAAALTRRECKRKFKGEPYRFVVRRAT